MAERNKRTAVFGIYSTREGVERAMDTFLQSGFTAGDISVLLPESLGKPTLVETSTVAGIYDESNTRMKRRRRITRRASRRWAR